MAQIKADEITQLLREQIQNYDSEMHIDEVGTIITLGDGIARIHGLEKVMAGELIEFPHGIAGLAMNLEEDQVGAVLMGDYTEVREGRGSPQWTAACVTFRGRSTDSRLRLVHSRQLQSHSKG